MTIWLVLSGLTNIILGLYITQLVDQRHNLDQAVADFEWIELRKLRKKYAEDRG